MATLRPFPLRGSRQSCSNCNQIILSTEDLFQPFYISLFLLPPLFLFPLFFALLVPAQLYLCGMIAQPNHPTNYKRLHNGINEVKLTAGNAARLWAAIGGQTHDGGPGGAISIPGVLEPPISICPPPRPVSYTHLTLPTKA